MLKQFSFGLRCPGLGMATSLRANSAAAGRNVRMALDIIVVSGKKKNEETAWA